MTTQTTPLAFSPVVGSPLHNILVEHVARTAERFHVGLRHDQSPFVCYSTWAGMSRREDSPLNARELVAALLASPRLGIEDPAELMLRALQVPSLSEEMTLTVEALINGDITRWLLLFRHADCTIVSYLLGTTD